MRPAAAAATAMPLAGRERHHKKEHKKEKHKHKQHKKEKHKSKVGAAAGLAVRHNRAVLLPGQRSRQVPCPGSGVHCMTCLCELQAW